MTMTRLLRLILVLLATGLPLRASDPIDAPVTGASASVKQPHVTAELIPETTLITAGQPFEVILHLHMDAGWHTYWINPGDSGLATSIRWTLPKGFTAGPIQWPTPEKHSMGPLVTYGYEGDAYLVTTITPPAEAPTGSTFPNVEISAKADWLVCQEECIPGRGQFSLKLSLVAPNATLDFKHFENPALFQAARNRLPVPNKGWDVSGAYTKDDGKVKAALEVMFRNKQGHAEKDLGTLQFFPEQQNVIDAAAPETVQLATPDPAQFNVLMPLVKAGDKPDKISGVLVSTVPLVSEKTGDTHAVYISEFPVSAAAAAVPGGGQGSESVAQTPPLGTAATTSAAHKAPPLLLAVLFAAFVGGLILNLMPCVLPVLSLKVFSLIKHAGQDKAAVWKQGFAFTAGVVVSFWVLAGILLALKAASHEIGWGFQMQSAGFVFFLVMLFFLLGLNLLGVFEIGTSLVGLDAKAAGHSNGLTSSFLNGALATIAATPCTAPFMGSALGFAAQQSNAIALLVFTFVALGMAAPYLLLTLFPAALKFVPKPGAWMETFKQFMGFLLLASTAWLIDVFQALTGSGTMVILCLLVLVSIAAWNYGRWQRAAQLGEGKLRTIAAALILLGLSLYYGIGLTSLRPPPMVSGNVADADGWRVWSQDAVEKTLDEGKPVFVDFTAAWCLSCKVNERVALDTDAVKKAFADKKVVLFKADWTHADPEITQALRRYDRDGVPLYLLYSPADKAQPQVLPEVLTPGIVLDAIGRLP
jgi:thiol:disulfide interchange protein DsbD